MTLSFQNDCIIYYIFNLFRNDKVISDMIGSFRNDPILLVDCLYNIELLPYNNNYIASICIVL